MNHTVRKLAQNQARSENSWAAATSLRAANLAQRLKVFLLADHDPVDDNLVTLGYLKVEDGRTTETIEVLPPQTAAKPTRW